LNSLRAFLDQQLLFCVTLFYIFGLLLINFSASLPTVEYICFFVLTAASLVFFAVRRNNLARVFLCLSFFFAGIISAHQSGKIPDSKNHIYTISSKNSDIVLIGVLNSMVEKYEDHAQLVVLTNQYRTPLHENFIPATGKIILRVQGRWDKDLLPGDTVIARAKVSHPEPASTEGGFDYKNYLSRKNIWAQGYLRSQVLIEHLETPLIPFQQLRYLPERIRARLADYVSKQINGSDGGLYLALLFGTKTLVDKETIDHFQETGVMHVLTISGLHISIFGVMLYTIFYFMLSRSEWLMLRTNIRKLAALLSVIPLIIYSLLAGGNTPVIRALFMALVVILALITDRRKSLLPLISFAAFFILLIQPASLYTASFQLSFAAVIAILCGKEMLQPLLKTSDSTPLNILNRLTAGLVVSLLATIGVAPLLLFHFNHISLIGPLTNLIVEPLICLWGLPFGFAALLSAPFSSTMAEILLQIGNIGLHAALIFTKWLYTLPFSISLWLPAPPAVLLIVYYFILFLLLQQKFLKRRSKVVLFSFCSVLIIGYYMLMTPIHEHGKTEITCFSVGQGSSSLIVTPSGKTILIDGGSGYSPGYNIGETVLRPYLFTKHIRSLDHLIITHPDSDHYNGLDFIIRHFSPRHIWISSIPSKLSSYTNLISHAHQHDIPVATPKKGNFISYNGKIRFDNFTEEDCSYEGDNDCGLVVRYQHEKFSMLFPADITEEREKIVAGRENIQSTVLLAPHHGSKSSSSSAFLKKVRPEEIIISSGRSKYFPEQSVLKRYHSLNIRYNLTRENGSITLESDGHKYLMNPTLKGDILTPQ